VVGKGWVLAADLQVGDQLQQSNGNSLTIDNIRVIRHAERVKVYNFTVADFHTYFVSDLVIWVHNIDDCGFMGIGDTNPIRTYRGVDLNKLEAKYIADPRLVVEMPYVGKNQSGTNAEGWLRDKDYYWKGVLEKYPESMSEANRLKIEYGFSPVNDRQFREHFSQYDIKELYNDTLIHHHVGGGGQAVAVPSKLHPGSGGIHNAEKAAGVWGNDSENAELLEIFLNK
jgi:hypothetical protein